VSVLGGIPLFPCCCIVSPLPLPSLGSPSSLLLFHPQSTPRAVACRAGGRWCIVVCHTSFIHHLVLFVRCRPSSVVHRLSYVICRTLSVICHSFVIVCRLSYVVHLSSFVVHRLVSVVPTYPPCKQWLAVAGVGADM
jgi:hypothetical protein